MAPNSQPFANLESNKKRQLMINYLRNRQLLNIKIDFGGEIQHGRHWLHLFIADAHALSVVIYISDIDLAQCMRCHQQKLQIGVVICNQTIKL
jgi:hypothetical protein